MKRDDSMFRNVILAELRRRGITPYGISKLQQGVHPGTVREFLYCGKEVMARTIEVIVKQLNLDLVPAEEVKLLRRLAASVKRSRSQPNAIRTILKELEEAGIPA